MTTCVFFRLHKQNKKKITGSETIKFCFHVVNDSIVITIIYYYYCFVCVCVSQIRELPEFFVYLFLSSRCCFCCAVCIVKDLFALTINYNPSCWIQFIRVQFIFTVTRCVLLNPEILFPFTFIFFVFRLSFAFFFIFSYTYIHVRHSISESIFFWPFFVAQHQCILYMSKSISQQSNIKYQ